MRARRTLASPSRPGSVAEHDRLVGPGDVAAVLGEAALHPDVDRAPQVPGGELVGRAPVDQDRAVGQPALDLLDAEDRRLLVVVEEFVLGSVGAGGEPEVRRRHRLAGRDGGHELVFGSSAGRRSWWPAARRSSTELAVERFFPQADPAPWAGNTRTLSGRREQLLVERAVQRPGQLVGR